MLRTLPHLALGAALVSSACGAHITSKPGDIGQQGGAAGTGGQGGAGQMAGASVASGGASVAAGGASVVAGGAGTLAAGGASQGAAGRGTPASPCELKAGSGTTLPVAMTNAEYDRTVRDLLGESGSVSTIEGFLPDSSMAGFRYQPAPVSTLRQTQLGEAAKDLAQNAVTHLAQILPCDPAMTGDVPCGLQFVATFGPRAFRRPLTDEESKLYEQVFTMGRGAADFRKGIQAVIASMLSSPSFYEILPKGVSGSLVPLTPFELASRLSYFIYRSMPDDALLNAAAIGKLVTKADVEREARRMLLNPKAHDGVTDFFAEWLSLDRLVLTEKDPSVLPTFDAVRADMATETIKFTESIFFGDRQFTSLLQSSTTWINEPLAQLYGQPGVVGMPFQQVKLDPKTRAGILTQASFLSLFSNASTSSPTRRGKFVRERLLCQWTAPPPANSPMTLPDMPGTSTRERLMMATAAPFCSGCHAGIDPIGFGFEGYDAVGRIRTIDGGRPVDATGQVIIGPANDVAFDGAVDLSNKLASTHEVRWCAATQWFRFARSQTDTIVDTCTIDTATQVLEKTGSLQELVVAIATSDAFLNAHW